MTATSGRPSSSYASNSRPCKSGIPDRPKISGAGDAVLRQGFVALRRRGSSWYANFHIGVGSAQWQIADRAGETDAANHLELFDRVSDENAATARSLG